jgi:hypothetical protein
MSKYTPGPWSVDGIAIVGGDRKDVCLMGEPALYAGDSPRVCLNADANAAFIVRACNAHDDLLAACEAARSWLGDFHSDAKSWPDDLAALSGKLRAAIAKAKEADRGPATCRACGGDGSDSPGQAHESKCHACRGAGEETDHA